MRSTIEMLIAVLLVALMGGVGFVFFSNEFNRAPFIGGGYIEEGAEFGISIGMDRSDAASILEANSFDFIEDLEDGDKCRHRIYPSDQKVEVWLGRSWRGGLICLASEDEVVVSLAWSFGGP